MILHLSLILCLIVSICGVSFKTADNVNDVAPRPTPPHSTCLTICDPNDWNACKSNIAGCMNCTQAPIAPYQFRCGPSPVCTHPCNSDADCQVFDPFHLNPCPECRGGFCSQPEVKCGTKCGLDRDCELARACVQCTRGQCVRPSRVNVTCGHECVRDRAQCAKGQCPDCIQQDRQGNFACGRGSTCGERCVFDAQW
jgi:hypothetical protein